MIPGYCIVSIRLYSASLSAHRSEAINPFIVLYELIIIIIIRRLNARRSPISHLFPNRWVSPLLGLALVSWAFARIGVHRLSLRFPYLMFSIRSSIVFLLYGRRIATHSVDPSLTHFLGEFPGLGLALVPDVVVPEADSCAHGAENSIQTSALAGVEPRTLALDYRAPLLLIASYDMQEATAGQF